MRRRQIIAALFFCAFSDAAIAPPNTQNEEEGYWREYGNERLQRQLTAAASINRRVAKNVVIFVGDGMGPQTVTMSRIYKGQKAGGRGEETELEWEKFPATGLAKTYNLDFQVPDSAGTATAIFSGVKTKMSVLGLDNKIATNVCDSEVLERAKVQGMLHWAQAAGKDTGVVTTARVTHATPGATYAHVAHRNWEADSYQDESQKKCDDIAKQLVYSDAGNKINVVLGGGLRNFKTSQDGGKRDEEDLVQKWLELKGDSGRFVANSGELEDWAADADTDFVLGLFSDSHMPYELDRDMTPTGTPSLSDMAGAAVKRLQRNTEKGFFLMVEGARIDHAHHENNAKRSLEEAVQMEEALKTVLESVDLDETLVIVTADHSHAVTMNGYPERGNSIFGYVYDEEQPHTSEYQDGTKRPYFTISYANGPGYFNHYVANGNQGAPPWKDPRDLDFENVDFLQPAMMPGPDSSESHGGEDVSVYATGPMAHLLNGVYEQSFIADVMAYSACVGRFTGACDEGDRTTSSAAATVPPLFLAVVSAALPLGT